MSLYRLNNYRAGDRSEYIAQTFITQLAFSSSVPRQEDFGVADYICFRSEQQGKRVYGKDCFYVQVKSKTKQLVIKEGLRNWIHDNLSIPFLFCIVDKKARIIELFSSWRLLYGIMVTQGMSLSTIEMVPYVKDYEGKMIRHDHSKKKLLIALHNPIIRVHFDEIEEMSKSKNVYGEILKQWLLLERVNIDGYRAHRAYMMGLNDWEPNVIPSFNWETYYTYGYISDPLDVATVKLLTAHCINYDSLGDYKRVELFVNIIKTYPSVYFDELTESYVRGDYKKGGIVSYAGPIRRY